MMRSASRPWITCLGGIGEGENENKNNQIGSALGVGRVAGLGALEADKLHELVLALAGTAGVG